MSLEDLSSSFQGHLETGQIGGLISLPLLVSVRMSLKSWVSPLQFGHGSPEFGPSEQFICSVCVAGRGNN